ERRARGPRSSARNADDNTGGFGGMVAPHRVPPGCVSRVRGTSSSADRRTVRRGGLMTRRGMLTLAAAAILLGLLIPACMGAGSAAKPIELKTDDDKTLYALGLQIGGTLMPYGLSATEI